MSWKKSILVICKILRLLVKTLTVNENYSLLNRDNLTNSDAIILKKSLFIIFFFLFFFTFSKSILNFKHFQKKITLIPDVYPKLRALKNAVR